MGRSEFEHAPAKQPIPIYIAANGPKACEAVGAYGDGWITAGADDIRPKFALVEAGAKKAGRKLPQPFINTALISGCVLRPGEKLTDERVIQETGSYVTAILHFAYEIWKDLGKKEELIPPYFKNKWGQYIKRVASFSLPEQSRFRQIHDGHCTYMQPGEEVFVTPEAIRGTCVAGTPEEIVHQLDILAGADLYRAVLGCSYVRGLNQEIG